MCVINIIAIFSLEYHLKNIIGNVDLNLRRRYQSTAFVIH